MNRAIGMIEFNSIAKGVHVTDTMLKAGTVSLVLTEPSCPGKYITLIEGDVGAVKNAVRAGRDVSGKKMINTLVIPNIHNDVFSALKHTINIENLAAMGLIETTSMASVIIAADAALKSATIRPIRIRLGMMIGGKGYFVYTGDVSAVQTAAQAAENSVDNPKRIVSIDVIPSPVRGLWDAILGKINRDSEENGVY